MKKIPNIYLVSNSPRRKAMFHFFNLSFSTVSIGFDETYTAKVPEDICEEICTKKLATSLIHLGEKKVRESVVVVADTLVFLENEIFGKPKDKDDARRMLQALSGKEHTVISAVGYSVYGEDEVFLEKTSVKFVDLSSEMIENYLEKEDYMDKAGSYAIQSEENFFVQSVSGSYANVVGFPMDKFLEKLEQCLS